MIGPHDPTATPTDGSRGLIEQLIDALELREAADQDSPPWLADREIRRLEHEILVSLRWDVSVRVGAAAEASI